MVDPSVPSEPPSRQRPSIVSRLIGVLPEGIKDYLRALPLAGFGNRDRMLTPAPYAVALYEELVAGYVASGTVAFCSMADVAEGRVRADAVNLVLRHDVDHAPEKLHLLTAVEERHGVLSSIYLRLDGQGYDPARVRDEAGALRDKGFEVGLHTVAYAERDALAAFARDVEQFESLYGFTPATATTHGFSMRPAIMRRRRRFLAAVAGGKGPPGTTLWDHSTPGNFDLMVSDSSKVRGQRWLTRNVQTIPAARPGARAQFMTHPMYWS